MLIRGHSTNPQNIYTLKSAAPQSAADFLLSHKNDGKPYGINRELNTTLTLITP